MDKRVYGAAILLLAAENASGQEAWIYQMVTPDDKTTTYLTPPENIAAPPGGVPAPIISGKASVSQHAVPITAQQEARRLQAPQLVIDTVPAALAGNLVPAPTQSFR